MFVIYFRITDNDGRDTGKRYHVWFPLDKWDGIAYMCEGDEIWIVPEA